MTLFREAVHQSGRAVGPTHSEACHGVCCPSADKEHTKRCKEIRAKAMLQATAWLRPGVQTKRTQTGNRDAIALQYSPH